MPCLNCRNTGWATVDNGHRARDGIGRQVMTSYCGCVEGSRLEARDRKEAGEAPMKPTSAELYDEACRRAGE